MEGTIYIAHPVDYRLRREKHVDLTFFLSVKQGKTLFFKIELGTAFNISLIYTSQKMANLTLNKLRKTTHVKHYNNQ